ncbi:MAG TPA: FoF1 ATP synthase subunit a [Ktedonobacterales bacterium]|nr:FoF1 ATP synthase subunit a [Ktedonobacterales bacterium]
MFWNLPDIKIAPDTLFHIGPFPVSNTLLATWFSIAVVIAFGFLAKRNLSLVPRGVSNFFEWIFELILNLCEEVAGPRRGRKFFPIVCTIFLFVLISNYLELVPFVESIGTITRPDVHPVLGIFLINKADSNALMPWVRPAPTDLNMTIGLAIISVVVTQIYGFRLLGPKLQLGRYFTLKEGPIGLVVGLLEAVLELARVISFSFRLFGNIFAGDVLLLVMAFLIPALGPVPFLLLETLVGLVQAFVFAMLTLVFMTLGTTAHEGGEHHEEAAHSEVTGAESAVTH